MHRHGHNEDDPENLLEQQDGDGNEHHTSFASMLWPCKRNVKHVLHDGDKVGDVERAGERYVRLIVILHRLSKRDHEHKEAQAKGKGKPHCAVGAKPSW